MFLVVILLAAAFYRERDSIALAAPLIAVALILILIIGVFVVKAYKARKAQRILAADVAEMTGLEFEVYVAALLEKHGFKNVRITERYDLGIDIVATKEGCRWGIQVKHYNGLVGVSAVRQVVTALNHYKCDRGMVITNSVFSRPAKTLAASNNCVLVDFERLAKL